MQLALELAEKLEASGDKTLDLFRGLSDSEWLIEVYSDGPAWNVHNLLAHFVEVEGSIPRLIRRILEGGGGVSGDFDIDRYNAKHVEEVSQQSRDALLQEFAERRKATIQMVRKMDAQDLESRGRHPFLGQSQVKDMLKLMFLHIRIHERDILNVLDRRR